MATELKEEVDKAISRALTIFSEKIVRGHVLTSAPYPGRILSLRKESPDDDGEDPSSDPEIDAKIFLDSDSLADHPEYYATDRGIFSRRPDSSHNQPIIFLHADCKVRDVSDEHWFLEVGHFKLKRLGHGNLIALQWSNRSLVQIPDDFDLSDGFVAGRNVFASISTGRIFPMVPIESLAGLVSFNGNDRLQLTRVKNFRDLTVYYSADVEEANTHLQRLGLPPLFPPQGVQ
jgi:hypothetical protein